MSIPSRAIRYGAKGRLRAAITGLAVFSALTTPLAYSETVRTGGTGAALGTMRLLANAYAKVDPQFSLGIAPNLGSGGGLKALEQGAVHFAVIGRPLKSEEAARGYAAIEYGRTPFVLATARADAAGITLRGIADIYAGRVSKWPDGTPIRLVLRPANDRDTALLASFSPAIKDAVAGAMAREGMIVAVTDQDSASEIGRIKGALGTLSLALIMSEKRALVALAIDGVKPTVKTLADGAYPYFKSVYIVTKGKPSEAAARFIAFVRSPEGRRILAETGHWVPSADILSAGADR
ncbi:MAG TPA: substrate-binding domain-containing protein [Burkholderiales bacterium]|nr:substrate-binding domain-containing protein [Burkholderiales bacterium]